MNRLLAALALSLALVGCGDKATRPDPQVISVAVPVHQDPPKAEDIEEPYLPVSALSKDSSDEEVAKAYAQSLQILKSHADMLRAALAPFIAKPKEETK